MAGGLMLSAFAPNVQFLIFSYGIVVGKETLVDNLLVHQRQVNAAVSLENSCDICHKRTLR